MNEQKDWIIFDLSTNKAIYGANGTVRFTSKDVANEVAKEFGFENFILINIVDDLGLGEMTN